MKDRQVRPQQKKKKKCFYTGNNLQRRKAS